MYYGFDIISSLEHHVTWIFDNAEQNFFGDIADPSCRRKPNTSDSFVEFDTLQSHGNHFLLRTTQSESQRGTMSETFSCAKFYSFLFLEMLKMNARVASVFAVCGKSFNPETGVRFALHDLYRHMKLLSSLMHAKT